MNELPCFLFIAWCTGVLFWKLLGRIEFLRKANTAWALVASELRLHLRPDGVIHGTFADCVVTLRRETKRQNKQSVVFTYMEVIPSGPAPIPPDLTITHEPEGLLAKLLSTPDRRIGDHDFDSLFRLDGEEVLTVAALSETTRRWLLSLRVTVTGGKVTFVIRQSTPASGEIVNAVRRATKLVRRLCLDFEQIPAALAANALSDSLPAVRRNNFRLLAARFPRHPVTREAAVKAVDHKDSHLRLAAARLLRDETGRHCLEQLVRASAVETSVRTNALRALVEDHGYSQVAKTVREFLFLRDDPVVVASAARLAGQYRDKLALEQLYALSKAEGDLAQAVAEALGKLEDPGATPVLLEFLKRAFPDLQKAAASSLGRVGTIEAVEPLLLLSREGLIAGELQETARDAVRQIQNRLGNADEGRLSLSPLATEAGVLSIVNDAGGVSIIDDTRPASNEEKSGPVGTKSKQ